MTITIIHEMIYCVQCMYTLIIHIIILYEDERGGHGAYAYGRDVVYGRMIYK